MSRLRGGAIAARRQPEEGRQIGGTDQIQLQSDLRGYDQRRIRQ